MTIKVDDNIYCCNGFCDKKNDCFRFVFQKCINVASGEKCLYLHNERDNCFVPIEEDK